ncbi:sialate O-acetylesterase-like [Patella vulgata]|uniref:sialate O-acetylesterase-like n=1 Tax=Patella vulgata TaxID=6465 RepID=UPI0021804785|nr:sialate O-acetylesterase-like [Patella vulgata]
MKVLFTVCFIFLYFKGSQGQKGSIKDATLSLASSYGDHMVLQKAPAFPGIWGYSSNVGDVITVQLLNTKIMQQIQTTVRMGPEGKGVWKVLLSPVGAGGPYSIKIYNSHGDSITINDVLFGDVWVCSGQSNMQFTVAGAFNATAEIADAASFPNIRVFTVAMETATVPQYDFISVEEPWSVASPASVGHGNWTYFSAVCWLYGKYLYQKLNYPIGLVASDWGGTPIETWSSTDALEKCGLTEDSNTDPDPEYVNVLQNYIQRRA